MDNRKIAVVGLGYVGLPVASAFVQKQLAVAFDINEKRIAELKRGYDRTGEVSPDQLALAKSLFSCDPSDLKKADFFIVAVPTPINEANQPDLRPILSASRTIAPHLKKGDIVVYESTVYPGATEEECVPVLEKCSGLMCGKDFFVGYSPERINPGDKEHTFTKIIKIVAGQNAETLDIIAKVYASVVTAGVYKASSIKVAEAAKVIENTQRDINIAFVNELAMIFHALDIDTLEVLKAAETKWNFLPFKPGLVGGHCIGVDPYYLTHKAITLGLHPQVILAGRQVNDNVGKFIGGQIAKRLAKQGVDFLKARIGILGLTFKEDCPDLRNTKVIDIIKEVAEYGATIIVHDPLADPHEAEEEYQIQLKEIKDFTNLDVIVLAVAHDAFKELSTLAFKKMLNGKSNIIMDVKGVLDKKNCEQEGLFLWRL